MTPFDWLLVAILTVSVIQAFRRGLVLELFWLGGLACGIMLAAWNYHQLAPKLSGIISRPEIASAAAFLLIALGTMIVAAILGRLIRGAAHAIGLGFLDRLGGAAFGLLRGGLIGVAILTALTAFLPTADWSKNSRLTPYFLDGVHAVSFVVPFDLQQLIQNGRSELKHNAPDWIKLRR